MTMPLMNGLDATRAILEISPQTRVLILTVHESEQLIREVFRVGARGYMLKSDAGSDLVAAVNALLSDRMYFTSKVAAVVMQGYLRDGEFSEARSSSGPLSPREREIVQLLAEGKSNKDIARQLQISVKTAETHRGNIMRKMEFESLSDLIRYAIKNGMLQP
jgi:DNA-binding NarL/FixJ family response regulator